MVIWKFAITDLDALTSQMTVGARVLAVQMQGDVPTMWVLMDPDATKQQRHFVVKGTGWNFDAIGLEYVATWQQDGFVWHLFERR